MIAQYIIWYKGAFSYIEVMNMSARKFFDYYDNLNRVVQAQNGDMIKDLQEKNKELEKPDLKWFKKAVWEHITYRK